MISFSEKFNEFLNNVRSEVQVPSFTKDYDKVESPLTWIEKWDLKNWRAFLIWDDILIAGAIVARDTPTINILEGRVDLALLWDIRIVEEFLGKGIGRRLLQAVEAWAIGKKCIEMKVETQNINVPACKFYEAMGFTLRNINKDAYEGLDEIQLFYFKNL